MKRHLSTLAAFAISLLFSGCETSGVSGRIQEKSAVFKSLDAGQQRDIQNRVVGAGFTTDMVYIALGRPSKIETSADGREVVWIYRNYYPPSANYQSQTTSVNAFTPTSVAMDRVNQARALNRGAGATMSGPSLSETRGGPQFGLDVADLPADTLFLYFRDGLVSGGKLASREAQRVGPVPARP